MHTSFPSCRMGKHIKFPSFIWIFRTVCPSCSCAPTSRRMMLISPPEHTLPVHYSIYSSVAELEFFIFGCGSTFVHNFASGSSSCHILQYSIRQTDCSKYYFGSATLFCITLSAAVSRSWISSLSALGFPEPKSWSRLRKCEVQSNSTGIEYLPHFS